MLLNSLKFGPMEIPENKIITMKRPILGFEHLETFCLIERDDVQPFLWLHSTEDPAVAFIVMNPAVFFPDYRIVVNPKEIAELKIKRLEAVETYVIVTVPDDPSQMTANLQGPVLINTDNCLAKQLVLVNSDYRVKHSVMDAAEAVCASPGMAEPVGV